MRRFCAAFLASAFITSVGVAAAHPPASSQSKDVRSRQPHANSNHARDPTYESWFFFGKTPDDITSMVNSYGARPVQIRVEDPTIPTFAGSLVVNSGPYYSDWWWYYGLDASGIGNLLDGRSLISLDPYQTEGLVFVAVMIPNVGTQSIAWWWYFGLDIAAVNSNLNANDARLISARPYLNGQKTVYAVIMVSNATTPVSWQWSTGQSTSAVTSTLTTNSQDRLQSLAPNPGGGWDTVLVPTAGNSWWWWTDLDPATITANLQTHNSLVIDLSSYLDNGVRKYAGVELGFGTSNSSSSSPTPLSASPTPSASSASSSHTPGSTSTRSSIKPKTAIIVGGVCGAVGLAVVVLVAVLLYRRGRNNILDAKTVSTSANESATTTPSPGPGHATPAPPNPGNSNYPNADPPMAQPIPQPVPQPIPQVTQPIIPPMSTAWAPNQPIPMPNYQYGYVPPTDAIFLQTPYANANPNANVIPPPLPGV